MFSIGSLSPVADDPSYATVVDIVICEAFHPEFTQIGAVCLGFDWGN